MFEDLTALEPKIALTRREFVVTTLTTGSRWPSNQYPPKQSRPTRTD